MERLYTGTEENEARLGALEMKAAGWDYVTDAGIRKNDGNFQKYFEEHPGIPVTRAAMFQFLKSNQHLFVARTPAQQKFDRVAESSGRTREELESFLSLLSGVGARHRVDTTGENYWTNAAITLQWMQGRPLDAQNLTLAIQNLVPRSQGGKFGPKETLIFTPEQVVDPRRTTSSEEAQKLAAEGEYRPGVLFEKDSVNQTVVSRFHNHAQDKPTPETTQTQEAKKEQDAWARINSNIVADGKSHAQREQLQAVLDRALAANGGSQRLANPILEQQYRSMYKRASTPITPLEAIIRGAS